MDPAESHPDTGERCLATVLPGTPIPCATTPVAVPIVGPAVGRAVAAVTVGVQHTCTLGHEGAVHCWGGNAQGQLGDGTPVGGDVAEARHVLDGAIDVQAGAFHTCALLLDGRVACWGRDAEAELGDGGGGARTTPVYVSGLDDIVAIAIGDSHGCALAGTGAVSCWGADFLGQLGDGSMEPAGMRAFTPVPAVVRTGS